VAEHCRSEWVRAQNLLASGGVTDQGYKAAELAERDARAQVALAVAQLAQARAQVERAEKMLRDSVVRAPVSGEIQIKHLNVGAYVEPPTALFVIVDNVRLELECMVATAEFAPIRPGQRVSFRVNAYQNELFEGHVIEINPAVQADTRSAKVRIRVGNPGRPLSTERDVTVQSGDSGLPLPPRRQRQAGLLKAGMFAQGEILTGVQSQAIVIPASAVYRDDRASKTSYVFVVDQGRATRREVRIGRERDSTIEVAEGLQPGDNLVLEQSIEIADGVAIASESRK
jgi:membrane fusion protein (multidrug efflux system)